MGNRTRNSVSRRNKYGNEKRRARWEFYTGVGGT